jgi:hypothetical protein
MNKLIYLLVAYFVLASCKKETEYVLNPPKSSESLKIDQVINDSTLVFKWGKIAGKDFFKSYLLKRSAIYFKNGVVNAYNETIDSSADINHLSFTENQMPVAKGLTYTLYAVYRRHLQSDSLYNLGSVSYFRPNSLVTGFLVDALIDRQNKRLYLTTYNNKISITDYDGRLLVAKELPFSIGYCALGSYNGSDELYVPVNDGTLHILDAGTLQEKDKIYVGGTVTGSVIAYNGKLYVSSSNTTEPPHTNSIKIYDRATKNIVGSAGNNADTRLLPLDGTSFEVIDLTNGYGSKYLNYHKFSADGVLISETKTNFTYSGYMNAAIMRSFPDGNKFITSEYGSIYDKSLSLLGDLKGKAYADFAFNNDGSVIYAANTDSKKINVISYPALSVTRSYPVMAKPFKIFRDGNVLVCVSVYDWYGNGEHNLDIVEKINL